MTGHMTFWRSSPVSYPQWLDILDLLCVAWTRYKLREGDTHAGCLLCASCWASQPRVLPFLILVLRARKDLLWQRNNPFVFSYSSIQSVLSLRCVCDSYLLFITLSDVCRLLKEVWPNWLLRNNGFHSCRSLLPSLFSHSPCQGWHTTAFLLFLTISPCFMRVETPCCSLLVSLSTPCLALWKCSVNNWTNT